MNESSYFYIKKQCKIGSLPMNHFTIHPIGIIHTPYKENKEIPIQGRFNNEVVSYLEIKKIYQEGLTDLDGFSHAYLLFYFHESKKVTIVGTPYLESIPHGIFAIRSPHRPNHIGLSIVNIKDIKGNRVYFTGADMLDGTPLLDIKPYVSFFDQVGEENTGWLEKHFKNGAIPRGVIHK